MSGDPLLQVAWSGLAPERLGRILERKGPERTVVEIVNGAMECAPEARDAVRIPVESRREELDALGVEFITRGDPRFPPHLAELPDGPRWLFVRGEMPTERGVAVVGSRKATAYGLGYAESIGRLVAEAGWPVVSGLAAGVDGAAHRGSLAAGGRAVAVLGSGIDVWYPRRHRELGERILDRGGAVLSEFPPGTRPEPWRFPCRNRIVSGLSAAVIVVEAAVRSGALITARLALDQGREVFVLPGDIDRPTSVGCNYLIRDGAHPVVSMDEIVEMISFILGPPRSVARPEPEIRLSPVPVSLDDLAVDLGIGIPRLLSQLAAMEAAGLVEIRDGTVRSV